MFFSLKSFHSYMRTYLVYCFLFLPSISSSPKARTGMNFAQTTFIHLQHFALNPFFHGQHRRDHSTAQQSCHSLAPLYLSPLYWLCLILLPSYSMAYFLSSCSPSHVYVCERMRWTLLPLLIERQTIWNQRYWCYCYFTYDDFHVICSTEEEEEKWELST